MTGKKRILVACGSSETTAQIVAEKIRQTLTQVGVPTTVTPCKAADVALLAPDADLVVTTTPVATDQRIPIIQTLAFITQIGLDAVNKQIIEELNA